MWLIKLICLMLTTILLFSFFGGHIIKCLCKMGHEFDDMKGYLPICVGNIPAN